ncbi:MAG: hypothetical protein WKF84_12935 [Pyrinomonadaceae bacterium]
MARQTSSNATVQIVPSKSEDERVEVLIEQHDGRSVVALKYATWTDGLGWCAQKTLRLDGDHLDDLQHALTVARHRINRLSAEAGEKLKFGKVIQLPSLT